MFWNFISWVLVIGIIVAVFEADKIPAFKKYIEEYFKNKKSKK